jgi:hypothetical protein
MITPKKLPRLAIAGLALLSAQGAISLQAAPQSHPNTTGWQNVFTQDLANVEMPAGAWAFENDTLVAKTHDTIWTKKSYRNVVLDLEFKVAKESNSGIFLRSGDIKKTLAALEIQVHDSADGALYGMVGAIYNAQPPSKNMSKPIGEWNRFTITCEDSRIALIFNGEEVFNIDLNTWTEPRKNPDGTANKFPQALKDFSRSGPLGLQGLHGKAQAPVWYRNIKIKELK